LKLFYWKKIFRSDLRDDQTSSNLFSEKHMYHSRNSKKSWHEHKKYKSKISWDA